MRGAAFVAVALLLLSGVARAEPLLTDLLAQPNYRAAWNATFVGETNVEPWIVAVGTKGDGVTEPSSILVVDGQQDRLGWVCKPHDCGDNQLFVLFSGDASRAWSLLTDGQIVKRWFGKPDVAVQVALINASHR